jgi:hypothetical protein
VGKRVSPMFAVVVIIFALVVGALYILMKFRVYDAAQAKEAVEMQTKAVQMQGKMGKSGGSKLGTMGKMGTSKMNKMGKEGKGPAPGSEGKAAVPPAGAAKAPAASKAPAAPK